MTKNKVSWKLIISIVLCIVITVCLIIIGKDFFETIGSESEIREINNIVYNKDKDEENKGFTRETYNELKALNSDFMAFIEFDSGLISLPVLQADDNEYYLNHTFYKKYYYLHGHPFMNYASTTEDQNIIIYGHNNRTSESVMFSPLNKLFDQKTYEKNSTFKIYFEDSVRYYVITNIYSMTHEEYQDYDFELSYISEEDWNKWISYANIHNAISSVYGGLEHFNNFVTLQTCAYGNEKIVVVLARETKREVY